jgi:site-specific recombinase XerD
MKWSFWIELYIRTHCVARGLRPLTLAAYENILKQFRDWVRVKQADREPDQIAARDVLAYVQHLREVRANGDSAINRTVVVLRRFYCAMVAMGYLDHRDNPLASFPSIRAVPRKLPVSLSSEQVGRLLAEPRPDTVLGLRDRALLALLYGTGIRASECASLRNANVDLQQLTITVEGKGGHQRTIPLNAELHLCRGPWCRAQQRTILPFTFRSTALARRSLRTGSHLGAAQSCRYSTFSPPHPAHLRHSPRACRRRIGHHPRSARTSIDHQHADLSACHRR